MQLARSPQGWLWPALYGRFEPPSGRDILHLRRRLVPRRGPCRWPPHLRDHRVSEGDRPPRDGDRRRAHRWCAWSRRPDVAPLPRGAPAGFAQSTPSSRV